MNEHTNLLEQHLVVITEFKAEYEMDLIRAYVHLGGERVFLVGERAGELDPSFWDQLAVKMKKMTGQTYTAKTLQTVFPKLRPQLNLSARGGNNGVDAERAGATATTNHNGANPTYDNRGKDPNMLNNVPRMRKGLQRFGKPILPENDDTVDACNAEVAAILFMELVIESDRNLLLGCAQNYTIANASIKEKFNAQTEQFKLASAFGERERLMKELALAKAEVEWLKYMAKEK
jgi:hypothetical protein